MPPVSPSHAAAKKNLFETLQNTCGELEAYLEKQLKKLLDEQTYQREFASADKRDPVRNLYIVPDIAKDEKTEQPEVQDPKTAVINYYKNCINLLINAQIFANAISQLHTQYLVYADKYWSYEKVREALELNKSAAPIQTEYPLFYRSLLAVQLNDVIAALSSASKINELVTKITPQGTVDSLKQDISIIKHNPLIASFNDQFDDWLNLVINTSSRSESIKRILSGFEKYLEENIDALDVTRQTVDHGMHLRNKASHYAASKKRKRDLLAFLKESRIAAMASVNSVPQTYVTLEYLIRTFFWESIYEVNLIFKNIFAGIRHAESYYQLQKDCLSEIPLWNAPIQKKGNAGELEKIKRLAAQKPESEKSKTDEKKDALATNSLYSIAKQFHAWVNKQGYEFEPELQFPYADAGPSTSPTEGVTDSQWTKALKEEETHSEQTRMQATKIQLQTQATDTMLSAIDARIRELNKVSTALCVKRSIKPVKIGFLADLKHLLQTGTTLPDALWQLEKNPKHAHSFHHVWHGKTGKMLRELTLAMSQPKDRCELISIEIVRLMHEREKKSLFRTQSKIAHLEQRITALRKLRKTLSQQGFTLAMAKQSLNALHRHDYSILIKNHKHLLHDIENIDKRITNVDKEFPNLTIGNRVIKPIFKREASCQEQMLSEINASIAAEVLAAESYVRSHPEEKESETVAPELQQHTEAVAALKEIRQLIANKSFANLDTDLARINLPANSTVQSLILKLKIIEAKNLEIHQPAQTLRNRLLTAEQENNMSAVLELRKKLYISDRVRYRIDALTREIPRKFFQKTKHIMQEKINLLTEFNSLILNHSVTDALDKLEHHELFSKTAFLLHDGRTGDLINTAATSEELESTIDAEIARLRAERIKPKTFFGDRHRIHLTQIINALVDLKTSIHNPDHIILKTPKEILMKHEKMIWDAYVYSHNETAAIPRSSPTTGINQI